MSGENEIECPDCHGEGFIRVNEWPFGPMCYCCNGKGWRAMTDEERDDASENAWSDMCESEPPVSMAEQHQRAWQQKQDLRR